MGGGFTFAEVVLTYISYNILDLILLNYQHRSSTYIPFPPISA